MYIRRDFAAAQINHVGRRLGAAGLLAALVKPKLQVPACEPITLEGLEGEAFRLEETQLVAELRHLRDVAGPVADVATFQCHLQVRQGRVDVIFDGRGRAVAIVGGGLRHARLKIHLHLRTSETTG